MVILPEGHIQNGMVLHPLKHYNQQSFNNTINNTINDAINDTTNKNTINDICLSYQCF